MSENPPAETDVEPVVQHREHGGTYRVTTEPADEGGFRFVIQAFNGHDDGGAQDFSEEDNPEAWRRVDDDLVPVYPNVAEAMEYGTFVLNGTLDPGEATLEWVETSLFGRLVDVAREAGLDSSGWSFGQHAGLSWTLVDRKPGPGLNQFMIWQRWQEARHGIEAMIAVLEQLRHQRDTGRAPADA